MESDLALARVIEDLIEVLIDKKLIMFTDFPKGRRGNCWTGAACVRNSTWSKTCSAKAKMTISMPSIPATTPTEAAFITL